MMAGMKTNWEPLGTRIRLGYHHLGSALMRARYLGHTKPVHTFADALASRTKQMLNTLARPMQGFVLISTRRLDPDDATHGTWNLVFEGQGRPAYAPGDMAYLSWRNPPEQVQNLLDLYGESGDRVVRTTTYSSIYIPSRFETMSLREALSRRIDLHEASNRLLRGAGFRAFLRHNRVQDKRHRRFHQQTAKDGGLLVTHPHFDYRKVSLPALLSSLERRPRLATLVRSQDRISARPYTMSGFQQLSGDRFRFEITVSQVEKPIFVTATERQSAPARGSQFFTTLVPGETVEGWILPEVHRFPSLGRTVPLIALCTGSGISSVLSLLRSGAETGPLWVIYGVRSWKKKHLYGPELQTFIDQEKISRLDVATSRPQDGEGPPLRVQGLLWQHRATVADQIRSGAHFYLCGRLSMGTEVAQTLEKILVDQGLAATPEAAHATLVEWHGNLRFQASVSGV